MCECEGLPNYVAHGNDIHNCIDIIIICFLTYWYNDWNIHIMHK